MDQALLHKMLWPCILLVIWLCAELLLKYLRFPRVSSYALGGYLLAFFGIPSIHQSNNSFSLMASIALGLMLFELGYRINLRWFRNNYWLLILGVCESISIFLVMFYVAKLLNLSLPTSLILASLSVSTSPAVILRVSQDFKTAGLVTERMFHLAALNCLLALIFLMSSLAYSHAIVSDWQSAMFEVARLFVGAAIIGTIAGVLLPLLFLMTKPSKPSASIMVILLVIILVNISHGFNFSPLLATLTFGIVAKKYRVVLTSTQSNFGVLGELLAMFLFVYVAMLLRPEDILTSLGLGIIVLAVRAAVRIFVNVVFAKASGTTYDKGFYTGLALMPFSAFAILLLEQTRTSNLNSVLASFYVVAGFVFLLDILGPYCTTYALRAAKEINKEQV